MAETTLKQCCEGTRGEPVELPTCPGFWVRRRYLDDENYIESVEIVDRDPVFDELIWFAENRPIIRESDKGEYYGPFKMVRLDPSPLAETQR